MRSGRPARSSTNARGGGAGMVASTTARPSFRRHVYRRCASRPSRDANSRIGNPEAASASSAARASSSVQRRLVRYERAGDDLGMAETSADRAPTVEGIAATRSS